MSLPYFPLYCADYAIDTQHLSTLEHGAYLLLLMQAWNRPGCRLPNDDEHLRKISGLDARGWAKIRRTVLAFWDEEDGYLVQRRLQKEWKRVAKTAEVARQNGAKGGRPKSLENMGGEKPNGFLRVTPNETIQIQNQIPEPQAEEKTPPSVAVAAPEPGRGGGDPFEDLWAIFPHNPHSAKKPARINFERRPEREQRQIIDAAIHYAAWFAREQARRGRDYDEGLTYAPTLIHWLENEAWKEAEALPLHEPKPAGPVIAMERLNRIRDEALWKECERIQGKRVPTEGADWSFKAEIVAQARAALAEKAKGAAA